MNIRGIIINQALFLNKEPYYTEEGFFRARPNASGFKIFLGKRYEDMQPYLPGEVKFYRNN